jgi:hypothetical protein
MQRPGAAPQTSSFGWCWRRSRQHHPKNLSGRRSRPEPHRRRRTLQQPWLRAES